MISLSIFHYSDTKFSPDAAVDIEGFTTGLDEVLSNPLTDIILSGSTDSKNNYMSSEGLSNSSIGIKDSENPFTSSHPVKTIINTPFCK